jgi:hypothetical protein
MKKIETKILFRAHAAGKIMTEAQGKSNKEKYFEALKSLEKTNEDVLKCSEKAIKTREKLEAKADKLVLEIEELEKVKDKIQLSKTCRDYLKTMAIELRYNRRKRMVNKYVKKGKAVEDDSILIYSEFTGEYLEKNTERINNDFFTGECDLNFMDVDNSCEKVTDIKSSFDIDSFEDNRDEDAKKDNRYQLLVYCDLWDAKRASVANVLTDNDFSLIKDELRRETFNFKPEELDGFELPNWRKIEIAKDNIFTYSTFLEFLATELEPLELDLLVRGESKDLKALEMFKSFVEVELSDRVIEIEIERDNEEIEKIKEKVKICREYMAEKYNIHHV